MTDALVFEEVGSGIQREQLLLGFVGQFSRVFEGWVESFDHSYIALFAFASTWKVCYQRFESLLVLPLHHGPR
ncbi:hypothetical protein C491_14997 [Natronococcus amylolyticus DSM 10524]|uniref:Uncharacterized protein n=1 Tax=Natronococcus amylolyticus DSM 10524 TaxID=1227497 RepID=L9X3G1_9EURY|nr:hypothetical protein C491_14997 [Natronococcus amylolyticus DSM 10524]